MIISIPRIGLNVLILSFHLNHNVELKIFQIDQLHNICVILADGLITAVQTLASTALCGMLHSIIGGQPLLILGVAEPTVLMYTFMFNFAKSRADLGSKLFLAWTGWYAALLCVIYKVINVQLLIFQMLFPRCLEDCGACRLFFVTPTENIVLCAQGMCVDWGTSFLPCNLRGMLYHQQIYPFGRGAFWFTHSNALHAASYQGEAFCLKLED